MEAKICDVFDFPVRDRDAGIMVDGMTILQSLPSQKPDPYPFVAGGREILDTVLAKVRKEFGTCHPKIVKDWERWASDVAPASDSVEQYLTNNPLYIPLGDILFSDKPVDPQAIDPNWNSDITSAKLQRMRTTDCVQWARWGFAREDHSVENFARVERVVTDDGRTVDVNALPERAKTFRPWKRRKNKKADERGDFKFILGRVGGKVNIHAPLTTEGQVIKLANGGCRIYWNKKKTPLEYRPEEVDATFENDMALGWYCYGRIVAPISGVGVKGDVLLEDEEGLPLPIQEWPQQQREVQTLVRQPQEQQVEEQDVHSSNMISTSFEDTAPSTSSVIMMEVEAELAAVVEQPQGQQFATTTVERSFPSDDIMGTSLEGGAQHDEQQEVLSCTRVEESVVPSCAVVGCLTSTTKKRKATNKWDGYVDSICGVLKDNIIATKRQRKKLQLKY